MIQTPPHMQAVILAGGKGVRMGKLTADMPKPMLKVNGKNLLQHKIDLLPREIDEVILVVNYKSEVIKKFFGESYGGRKITYVEQGEPHGTAHALFKSAPLITGDFVSMFGDDIYPESAIIEVIKYPWALTAYRAKSIPTAFRIEVGENGYMKDAIADDKGIMGEMLLDVGLYKMKPEIFTAKKVLVSTSQEEGLPHTFYAFVKDKQIEVKVVIAESWYKINTPEDLAMTEAAMLSRAQHPSNI